MLLKMFVTVTLSFYFFAQYICSDTDSELSTIDLIEERKRYPYVVLIIITPTAFLRSGSLISPELVLTTASNIHDGVLPLIFVNVIDSLPYAMELRRIKDQNICLTVRCYIKRLQHINESPLIKMIITDNVIYSNMSDIALLRLKYMAKLVANWNYASLGFGKLKQGSSCEVIHWGYRFPFEVDEERFMVVRSTKHRTYLTNNKTINEEYIFSTQQSDNDFSDKNSFFLVGAPLICHNKQYGVVVDSIDRDARSIRLTPHATWIIKEKVAVSGKLRMETEEVTTPVHIEEYDEGYRDYKDYEKADEESQKMNYKKLYIPSGLDGAHKRSFFESHSGMRGAAVSESKNNLYIQITFLYIKAQIYYMLDI